MSIYLHPSGPEGWMVYLEDHLPNFLSRFMRSRRKALRGRADILLPMLLGRKAHHSVQSCFSFCAMPMIAANHEHKVALWEEAEIIDGSIMLDLEAFRRKGMLECAGYVVLKINMASSVQQQLFDLKKQWDEQLADGNPLLSTR